MVFRYPNGQIFHGAQQPQSKHKQSAPQKQLSAGRPSFSNRGMKFEEAINLSNEYYLNHQIAVIHKKPTPIQIVTVDYPRRSAAVIKEAYFKEASTTDYNGVYRGYYLDFEAKETKNKTSFPFKNFHEHQLKHMENCLAQGGICFVLLWFSELNRCFFLSSQHLLHYWQLKEQGKKSLPLSLIEELGIEIPVKIAPRVPYLAAVDQYLMQKGATNYGE